MLKRDAGDNSAQGLFDRRISGITIYNTENKTYTARHKLTTENIVVENGGAADFYAYGEVELKPGFEAQSGCETFIYCAPVETECNSIVSYKTNETNNHKSLTSVEQKTIGVKYSLAASAIKLLPNPANDLFFVESSANGLCRILITDITGSKVFESKSDFQNRTTIDISNLSAGYYRVQVSISNIIENFKLIVNR